MCPPHLHKGDKWARICSPATALRNAQLITRQSRSSFITLRMAQLLTLLQSPLSPPFTQGGLGFVLPLYTRGLESAFPLYTRGLESAFPHLHKGA